ncbi:hypothetical protein DER46DRAFT_652613 [Fusarium sp. MPI-SDFR-AT-0072]|nr:hypothetical protein DER46DRAFT_652613 [Fusarium sp. MPI-SDFR-AT-0072]
MGAMTLNWGDAIREVVFHVDEEVVKKWELELLDTEYTGIAYQEKGDASFQNPYEINYERCLGYLGALFLFLFSITLAV